MSALPTTLSTDVNPYKRIIRVFAAILGFILLLATVGLLISLQYVNNSYHEARSVSLAGRQCIAADQLSKQILLLYHTDSSYIAGQSRVLQVIELHMHETHNALIQGSDSLEISTSIYPEGTVERLCTARLHIDTVHVLVDSAVGILHQVSEYGLPDYTKLTQTLLPLPAVLLRYSEEMDDITEMLNDSSQKHIAAQRQEMLIIYFLFIVAVLIMAIAVLFPMVKKLRGQIQQVVELQIKTAKLELADQAREELQRQVDVRTQELRAANEELQHYSQTLSEREEWWKLALEANEVGIWDLYVPTMSLRVTDKLLALRGYTPEEVEVSQEWVIHNIHADDREAVRQSIQSLIEEGKDGEVAELRYRIRHKNNSFHWIRSRCVLKRDHDGTPLRIVGTNRDITDVIRSETSLRVSEERYRSLFHNMSDVFVRTTMDGTFLDLTPSVFKNIGYTAEELIGQKSGDLYANPEQRAELLSLLHRESDIRDYPLLLRHRSGGIIHCSANIMLTTLHDGTVVIDSVIRNISVRVAAEQQLLRREQQLIEAQRIAKLGSFEHNLQSGESVWSEEMQRIIYGNEAGGEYIAPPFAAIVMNEDIDNVIRKWNAALESKTSFNAEYRIYQKSGILLHIQCLARIEIDSEGKPLRVIGTLQDITEHKLLHERQERLISIIEATPNIIGKINLDGRLTYLNANGALKLGYASAEETYMRTMTSFYPRDIARRMLEEYIPEAIAKGIWTGETAWIHRDGRHIPMQQTIIAHKNSAGYLSYLSTVAVDVSERKHVEEVLTNAKLVAESASRAKSVFLSSMSHELRTPLNAILGFAQILQRDSSIPQRQRGYIDIMYRSGNHLLDMINDVLDISKIEADRMELTESDFDVEMLLHDIDDMFAVRAREKQLELTFISTPDIPRWVHGDAKRLRQVLINLVGNAIKFTQAGFVEVRMAVTDASTANKKKLHFSVSDSGRGIPQEQLATIFQPFRQVSGTYSEGTGLGLAITSRIVSLMGGELCVESQIDKGSTFSFSIELPFVAKINAEDSVYQRVTGIAGNRQYTILVADDIPSNVAVASALLEQVGFQCISAANGEEAIQSILNHKPDIALVDLHMPVMDGVSAVRSIRTIPEFAKMPIIALTASSFKGKREELIEQGFTEYISKPFREQDVFRILEECAGVEFIRESQSSQRDHSFISPLPSAIAEAIRTLPDAMRSQLAEAVELQMLDDIITIITTYHLDADGTTKESFMQLRSAAEEGSYRILSELSEELTERE